MSAIPPNTAVADLAGRQHGVVARRQLLDLGVPSSRISRWSREGYLHSLHRGVYAVGHRRISQEGRWLAGVLACGPGAALSFGAAGQCRGILPAQQRLAVHVSVPHSSGANPDGVAVHRVRSLADVSLHRGIPTTTATRTVWDLASVLTPLQVRRAFEQAEKLRVLDRERLGALRSAAPSRRGAAVIRQLLAEAPLPLEATRSWLEEVIADGGDHLSRRQRRLDNERDAQLGRAGFLIRRFEYYAAVDRDAVAAELALILRERGNEAMLGY